MAPTGMNLVSRYVYSNCNSSYENCYYSPWNSWGRWVALVCIIAFVLFIAVVFSCINNKRRRQRGMQPRYGTGWMGGKTPVGQPSYGNGYQNGPAAPPYQPPQHTGNTFNSNDGYYGGQQSGIELQHPQNTYQGNRNENVYNAPPGAPPHKGDGFIR